MPLDLLDTPLRITWDLHGSGGSTPAPLAEKIAERLVEGGVFFATLQETPLAHPACSRVATLLQEGGCALSLHYQATLAERAALAAIAGDTTVLFDVASFLKADGNWDETALVTEWAELRRHRIEPLATLTPTRLNLPALPRLLALCRACGVGKIKLPNTRADDSFCRTGGALLPTPDDLAALAGALGDAASASAGIELEVHDLFLWELLQRPGETGGRSEYGGCQAGNSLAHVTSAGEVWGCSSWPAPLGSLRENSLAEIWAAPSRLALREAVARVPTGCVGCRDYHLCFGGCRGLSATVAPAGDGRDLLCAECRN